MSRHYTLTTRENKSLDNNKINNEVKKIRHRNGFEVIVNALYTISEVFYKIERDTKDFIKLYTNLIVIDETLKFEHKSEWNKLCSNI